MFRAQHIMRTRSPKLLRFFRRNDSRLTAIVVKGIYFSVGKLWKLIPGPFFLGLWEQSAAAHSLVIAPE